MLRTTPYTINGRFDVVPQSNLLADCGSGEETRLEPRLMEVLCRLSDQAGQTVLREDLVQAIWQDYGGGDEGLTQAISVLRKVLQDSDKQLIRTVPKKGYLFTGVISATSEHQVHAPVATTKSKVRPIAIVLSILLIGAVGLYYFGGFGVTPDSSVSDHEVIDSSAFRAHRESEENSLNTIVAEDSSHRAYKLVMVGDRPPKFFIDNQAIPEDQWAAHMDLIDYLKRKLQERRKTKTR